MISTAPPRPVSALQKPPGSAYIKFWLDAETPAVLPMSDVQEVLRLPAQRVTPMPAMPTPMLGLISRRSKVFWLVDFGLFLGRSRLDFSLRDYELMMIAADAISIGLAVPQIDGMVWLKPETMQPIPKQHESNRVDCIAGYIRQEQQVLWVFSAKPIVRSPILHHPI
jgi:positive phototaxis protein PixI